MKDQKCMTIFNISAQSHVKQQRYWVKMLLFWPSAQALLAPLQQKKYFLRRIFALEVLNFFSPFCSASPEIIGLKVDHRQTNSLTPYTRVCIFFFQLNLLPPLLASLAGGLTKNDLSILR